MTNASRFSATWCARVATLLMATLTQAGTARTGLRNTA